MYFVAQNFPQKLLKMSHHLPRARTTFINKVWRLMTSIACSRELNKFYNSKPILDSFSKNENRELRINFICKFISLFFWSVFKKARESRRKMAWRKVLPLSKSILAQFLWMYTFPSSVSDCSAMISQ